MDPEQFRGGQTSSASPPAHPGRLLLTALGVVFIAEFVVMLILSRFQDLPAGQAAILDAVLLASFLLPPLFFLVFKARSSVAWGDTLPLQSWLGGVALLFIFGAEAVIMMILTQLPELPAYQKALLDSVFLSVILLPPFYLLLLKSRTRTTASGSEWIQPNWLFAVSLLAVFAAEAAVMIALSLLPPLPTYLAAILDALILSGILLPFLHVFFLKPIRRHIEAREMAEKERETLIVKLQESLAEIKELRGMIPICCECKKIRDDGGYWHRVEAYIQEHTNATFSHGYCPECESKMMAEIAAERNRRKTREWI